MYSIESDKASSHKSSRQQFIFDSRLLDSFALLRRVYYELSLYESYAGGHKFKAVAKGAKVDRAPRKIRVPRRFGSVVLTHRVT